MKKAIKFVAGPICAGVIAAISQHLFANEYPDDLVLFVLIFTAYVTGYAARNAMQ